MTYTIFGDLTMFPPNLVQMDPCPFQNTCVVLGVIPKNRRQSRSKSLVTNLQIDRSHTNLVTWHPIYYKCLRPSGQRSRSQPDKRAKIC